MPGKAVGTETKPEQDNQTLPEPRKRVRIADFFGLPWFEEQYKQYLDEARKHPEYAAREKGDRGKGKEVAADFIIAEEDLCDAVLSDEILSAINTLADKLPEAGRKLAIEKFKQTALEALGAPSAPQAVETLASVKGGATLLRQWHVYQRLLTSVVLPTDKQIFETLEEAKAAKSLETTYRRARARQAEIGVELVPENDKYIKKVASAATLTYLKFNSKSAALVA